MAYYTEQLQELQQQIARKKHLEKMLKELVAQQQVLTEKVKQLESIKLDEKADVERLENPSLAAFFYALVGKKEDMLDKERREAYAAVIKHDAAVYELSSLETQIGEYEQELLSLQGCQERYAQVLQEKEEAVKASGTPEAEQIFQMAEKVAYFESQLKELDEAIIEGKKAYSMVLAILTSLNRAESWGALGFMGGGLISNIAKHKNLDGAQWQVKQLQVQLDRFKTVMADLAIRADMKVNVDGALRFADYFSGGIFADLAVMDRINQSQDQVHKTYKQISDALSTLYQLQLELKRQQAWTKNQLDALVEKAEV